mmetsp:Transcript_52148/g.158437  ORF Transcript_52148/g.158437 Transcript_52148/m.158437 type:complete len:633 (-) Transcript_52148:55-1953(-)
MHFLLLSASLFAISLMFCDGALNIEMNSPEDMLRNLRQAIFVETSHLAERREVQCSSIDGPSCLRAFFGREGSAPWTGPALDGPGVIPERLLHDLGVAGAEDLGFSTPEYSVLEAYTKHLDATAKKERSPLLTRAILQEARGGITSGILHFQGLLPDSRLPLSFSHGLPGDIVATWDGRWLIRDCGPPGAAVAGSMGGGGHAVPLALPSPDGAGGAGGLVTSPGGPPSQTGGREVSVTAELAGSVGYVRFSKPVVVRSLFARWHSAEPSSAVIGGRLGLESSWTTHLDAAKLKANSPGAWLDIAGGAHMRPVDEIAFVGAQGLEVGAVEVAAQGPAGDDETFSAIVLSPMTAKEALQSQGVDADAVQEDADVAPEKPMFGLRVEKVSLAAAPYLASLDEVISHNLRLVPTRSPRAPGLPSPSARVPGLLSALSPAQDLVEATAVAETEAMFHHSALMALAQWHLSAVAPQSALASLLDPSQGVPDAQMSVAVKALAEQLGTASPALPQDLRRSMERDKDQIVQAVLAWVKDGGRWHKTTPSTVPHAGSEASLARYVSAKDRQTKFDLLTATFLHNRQQQQKVASLGTKAYASKKSKQKTKVKVEKSASPGAKPSKSKKSGKSSKTAMSTKSK